MGGLPILNQTFHIGILQPNLDPCFLTTLGKIQVLRDNFGEIWRIQIQMYPQTSFEPIYGEFYLKNKVSAHGLVLLVQLS